MLKFYFIRSIFCKGVDFVYNDYFEGFGWRKLKVKILRKGYRIFEVMLDVDEL